MSELRSVDQEEKVLLSDMLNMRHLPAKLAYSAAKALADPKSPFPVLYNLQLSKLDKDSQIKTLAAIIASECGCKKVPFQLFCEGAWRPSANQRVSYHSQYSLSIYKAIAIEEGLPTLQSFYMEYMLVDNDFIRSLQPLYKQLNVLNAQRINDDKLIDRIIDNFLDKATDRELMEVFIDRRHIKNYSKCRYLKIDSSKVYNWNFDHNAELLVMAGTYQVNGVHGYAIDSDGQKFEHTFQLSPMQTKIESSQGESAFAKNPLPFLATKFMRHCATQYYKTCASSTASILDPEDIAEDTNPDVQDDQGYQDRAVSVAKRVTALSKDYSNAEYMADLPKLEDYVKSEDQHTVKDNDDSLKGTI